MEITGKSLATVQKTVISIFEISGVKYFKKYFVINSTSKSSIRL